MEKTVRILEQSGLQQRKYTDKKTQEEKTINLVQLLRLDKGFELIDTFVGEITGERAVNCPTFDKNYQYRVQCSMQVRGWNSERTGEAMQATTIYVEKIKLI